MIPAYTPDLRPLPASGRTDNFLGASIAVIILVVLVVVADAIAPTHAAPSFQGAVEPLIQPVVRGR